MELKKSQTIKNMARAFAGECQAGARYQFLRKQATQKQMPYLAGVLKILATNEMAHAKVLFDKIVGCSKKIIENIEITAGYPFKCGAFDKRFEMEMENERSEAESIYPSFAVKAREEGFEDIAELFDMIGEVEKSTQRYSPRLSKKCGTAPFTPHKNPSNGNAPCADTNIRRRKHGKPVRCAEPLRARRRFSWICKKREA